MSDIEPLNPFNPRYKNISESGYAVRWEAYRMKPGEAVVALPGSFVEISSRGENTAPFESFVISPGDSPLEPLRESARRVEATVFFQKDGNSRADLDQHYGRFEPSTWWILIVDRQGEVPVPAGAMRLVAASPLGLPSVNDIAFEPWRDDPLAVMQATRLPDGSSLPDLRAHPRAMDIVTVAVLEKYRRRAPAWGLYAQLCKLSRALRVEYWATILDTAPGGALSWIQKQQRPFQEYAEGKRLKPGVYFASTSKLSAQADSPANASLPFWSHVPELFERQRNGPPEAFQRLWADGLSSDLMFDAKFEVNSHNTY